MKKKFYLLAFICMLLCGLSVFSNTNAAPSHETTLQKWGQYLSNSQYDMKTYAVGENIRLVSSDVKQAQMFYILSGMSDEAAMHEAIVYMAEREVLYLQAIEAGYDVTDAEVQKYLQELNDVISTAENKEDAQIIMAQFDSEEEYWEYEFKVYKKNLPVQRFVADLESDFMEKNTHLDDAERETAWITYFNEYKKTLLEAENLNIVG